MQGVNILILDIETGPNTAYVWGKYKQNVIDFEEEWSILCWSAKWLGEKKVYTDAIWKHKGSLKTRNDKGVLETMHPLMDRADIIIAHNGDRFDIKKLNSRFLFHGITPPSPYDTIDTLKVFKKKFALNSNSLNSIAKYLGLGSKVEHEGYFKLWKKCIDGVKSSQRKMLRYNRQDVVLLEEVYKKVLPWIDNHPNIGLFIANELSHCRNCGSERLWKKGTRRGYQRYRCRDCGKWLRARGVHLTKEHKQKLMF